MRSILCLADSGVTLDDRLETSLALARATGGHVSLRIASPLVQVTAWEPFGGAAISAAAIAEMREADEKLRGELEHRLAPQDVPFDIEVVDQGRIEAVAAASRFADVIVASLDDPVVEEVALGVRCPVLAVPRGKPLLAFDKPVLVAWDGGHEAATALRAALPLLALAAQVHILTVREKADDFPARDAACYLSRHGVHAQVHDEERKGSVTDAIENAAARLGAGLIVMGVFGHSRLRELLLGGVSRDLLDRSQVPLLLAH